MQVLEQELQSFFLKSPRQHSQVWKDLGMQQQLPKVTHKSFVRDRMLIAFYMLMGGNRQERQTALGMIRDAKVEAMHAPLAVWGPSMFVRQRIARIDLDALGSYPCTMESLCEIAIVIDKMSTMRTEETCDFGAGIMKNRILNGGDMGMLSVLPLDLVKTIAEKI